MKKFVLLFLFFSFNLIPYLAQAEVCSLGSEDYLRGVMYRYARACGSEGDSSLRYSTACSDYNTNPATASDRALYNRECAFVGDTTYSVCGCLRHKDCYSEDALFRELSCTGTRSTSTPTSTPSPTTQPAGRCGDGTVQPELGEQCELPYVGNCNEVCKWVESKCGDGRVDFGRGEECEPPSSTHDGWECNENCKVKKVPPAPKCGDGALNQTSEECEPAGTATCDANCKRIRFCGDGIVDTDLGEQCEHPNTTGCDRNCKKIGHPDTPTPSTNPPRCGDGIIQTERGESCELPNVGNCSKDCAIVLPQETPLVQQTLELLLEGGGGKCSLDKLSLLTSSSSSSLILLSSFGSLIAFRIFKRRK